jgi:hypothetical protein
VVSHAGPWRTFLDRSPQAWPRFPASGWDWDRQRGRTRGPPISSSRVFRGRGKRGKLLSPPRAFFARAEKRREERREAARPRQIRPMRASWSAELSRDGDGGMVCRGRAAVTCGGRIIVQKKFYKKF